MICALDTGVEVTAIVDDASLLLHFVGLPVATSFEAIVGTCDAVLVTDPRRAAELTAQAITAFWRRPSA